MPRDVTSDGPPFLIRRDGTWLHGDAPIVRLDLARLFASILYRHEDGSHWMENPGEICRVNVEDTAYVASRLLTDDAGNFHIQTTIGETFPVDVAHPLSMRGDTPVVAVRHGCAARLPPQLYYALAEQAEVINGEALVTSFGARFSLGNV